MKPFLFLRGNKNYARFLIPTKFKEFFEGQKFLTFALGAGEGHEIRKKASNIEFQLVEKFDQFKTSMKIDFDKIRKYEIDLDRGVLRADGEEDHERMIEALGMLKSVSKPSISTPPTP